MRVLARWRSPETLFIWRSFVEKILAFRQRSADDPTSLRAHLIKPPPEDPMNTTPLFFLTRAMTALQSRYFNSFPRHRLYGKPFTHSRLNREPCFTSVSFDSRLLYLVTCYICRSIGIVYPKDEHSLSILALKTRYVKNDFRNKKYGSQC